VTRLEQLARFAVYYGPDRLQDLAAFELVILQAEHYGAPDVAALHREGTIPVAYLSIGEQPQHEAPAVWTLIDPQSGRPALNGAWQTAFVDCRVAAWRRHLVHERVPRLLSRGFVGLFLDTLDVQERYPQTRQGVAQLLRDLRAQYPQIILIANRGFSLLPEAAGLFNAFLFEAFTTRHMAGRYQMWDEAELDWTAKQAAALATASGQCPLLALDYAPPDHHVLRRKARERALAHGLVPYVTTWTLDWLPPNNS
jgi:uncharacterized protein (TIGR01370 family)